MIIDIVFAWQLRFRRRTSYDSGEDLAQRLLKSCRIITRYRCAYYSILGKGITEGIHVETYKGTQVMGRLPKGHIGQYYRVGL